MNEKIVFDCGSHSIKVGYSGDSEPSIVIPSTGPTIKISSQNGLTEKIVSKFGTGFKSPIENRNINNLENMVKIWDYIYSEELKINPENHSVLFSDSPLSPYITKQNILQIFMETYHVPSFCLSYSPTLSLYNIGLTSGIIIDSGENVTDIIPVFECFTLSHLIKRIDIGGKQINEYLKLLLKQKGININNSFERDQIRDIKEQISIININNNNNNNIEKSFLTLEGNHLNIGKPRYQCTEILFDPSIISIESNGISNELQLIINQIDDDIYNLMKSNIILTGGTSLISGFGDRIQNDLISKKIDIEIKSLNNKKFSNWAGGSILSSISTFDDLSISQIEYNEEGINILERKLF